MTGLYIHIPFCVKKCRYCDFYSLSGKTSLIDKYAKAVMRSLHDRHIYADTVYFGGGTPSLLSPKHIYDILSEVEISENAEITLECNPGTVDKQKLSDILSAGINRLSVGIQSFDSKELSAIGRIHDPETAVSTIRNASEVGFENISCDLMLGLPYQTESSLENNIRTAVSLDISHISAYMLKVEENTPLAKDEKLLSEIPDDDRMADMYKLTNELLYENGFERYEISNFAKKGMESRHNLLYWKREDYYSVGPSSHFCLGNKRGYVPQGIEDFINSEKQTEIITETLSEEEMTDEKIMLGLRLSEGIDPNEFESYQLLKKAKPLIQAGLMRYENDRLSLTTDGCLVSNEIIIRMLES